MKERYPVLLIQRNSAGVSVSRLETRSDEPDDNPDTGLLLIQVPSIPEMEIIVSDSDERFPQGSVGPCGELVPRNDDDPHWKICSWSCNCCIHLDEMKYKKTDLGWYLVIQLPDNKGEVWINEIDVPIHNLPSPPPGGFGRRPSP